MATVLALALVASTTEATLNCQSPTGSYSVGDSVSMQWGDNGWWPKASDVYSATANVYCSSGGSKVASFGVSNGDSWTIPNSAYGGCSGNQLYVEYTGNLWDITHWFHVLPYWTKCSSFTLSAPPPPPPTTQPPKTTDLPPQPPTTNPQPPTVPPVQPTTTAPGTTTTPPPPPVYTSTVTLVTTVIDGTSTVVPVSTIVQVSPNVTAHPLTTPTTASFDPNASEVPQGLPSGSNDGQANRNNNNSKSNVPVAALASVAGVAALALLVFGLVMTRKHKRLRREQDLDKELNNSYGAELGASAGGTAAAAAIAAPASTYSTQSSFNNHPMPYLEPEPSQNYHNPDYDFLAAGAGAGAGATVASRGMGAYGYEEDFAPAPAPVPVSAQTFAPVSSHPGRISDFSTGDLGGFSTGDLNVALAAMADNASMLAFPVPPSTVNTSAANAALQQQFALAGRLSIDSQESSSFITGGTGAGAAAAAVNQQLSLKQEFDEDESVGGDELYYLQTGSPSQTYQSAVGTPVASTTSEHRSAPFATDAATRSSAYDTVPSSSSAYATADSPSLSATSLQSQDIHVPTMEPSDWRLTGSGRPESSHIRDLIRNVLDDE